MKLVLLIVAFLSIASAQSICDRYSVIKNITNAQLVGAVVGGTFQNITAAGSPIKSYFDGSFINFPGGRTINFLTDTNSQATLSLHLVQFFGMALSCTDKTIATYAG